ncbi:hypothetical protein BDZ89DRAFT_1037180 [Hymenopellis radicata]|nr:hypothetical protein BDZ89DRAFT_1037180 [Hymenopellis radicata]
MEFSVPFISFFTFVAQCGVVAINLGTRTPSIKNRVQRRGSFYGVRAQYEHIYMDDYDRFGGLGKRESNTTPGEDQGPERRLWLYMIKACQLLPLVSLDLILKSYPSLECLSILRLGGPSHSASGNNLEKDSPFSSPTVSHPSPRGSLARAQDLIGLHLRTCLLPVLEFLKHSGDACYAMARFEYLPRYSSHRLLPKQQSIRIIHLTKAFLLREILSSPDSRITGYGLPDSVLLDGSRGSLYLPSWDLRPQAPFQLTLARVGRRRSPFSHFGAAEHGADCTDCLQ